MRKIFGVMLIFVGIVAVFADDPPAPLSAALVNPGYRYAPSGAFELQVAPACTASNPSGTHYQFMRASIISSSMDTTTTSPLSVTNYTFTGAADGEKYAYFVRAIYEDDTSYWSDPLVITHDLEPPHYVSYLIAQHCCADTSCAIYLTWQKVDDFASSVNGSEVRGYAIYRSPTAGGIDISLGYITTTTPALVFIPSDGREIYNFIDTEIVPGETYRYTVVAFDSAGYPTAGSGHFQHYDNTIVSASAVGPGVCNLPLRAVLESVPRVVDATNQLVRIDASAVWLKWSRLYQFIREDISCGTSDTTNWTNVPYYTWSIRDCHRYNFYARIRDDETADTSDWFMRGPMLVDRSGPQAIDSTAAHPNGNEIHTHFYIHDESALDCLSDECGTHCGIGVMQYKLYRVNIDSLDSFFPYDPMDTDHLLYTYNVDDTFRTDVDLLFRDDGTILPLEDNQTYRYILVAFDSLGHYSYYSNNMDTATADLGIVDPMLLPLDTWSSGDCVTLQIVDTSHCDFDSIYIEQSISPDFTAGAVSYGPYQVHDAVFSNPDDGDCSDWDTLTFDICGLEEAQYYFRIYTTDRNGNVSEYSNVVNTRFDNTPPTPVSIDSIYSRAVCTDEMKITIWWSPASDAGIGVQKYNIYRSDTPGVLGSLVGTVEHNPFLTYYSWTDNSPNPSDNFRDNYYTVASVDNFDLENTSGIQKTFDDGMPPYPVRIDTVYPEFISGEMFIVIEWSDTTPYDYGTGGVGNSYRVEHSADESWLCIGDPDIIDIEPPTYNHRLVLPRTIIVGSPHRFFHIATIDPWGNESAYSEPYEYVDSSWSADSMVVHLYYGWNMVGLPVLPRSLQYRDVFPSALSAPLSYSADSGLGYFVADTMQIGYGYWIYSPGDMDVQILGYHIPYINRSFTNPGWYIVSGITDTTGFSITPPDSLAMTNLLWFNPTTGAYDLSTELFPGRGYWLLANGGCQYDVPGGALKIYSDVEPEWFGTITAGKQKLIFGIGSDKLDLMMPPSPPETKIPSLVSDGRNLIRDISENNEWTINLPEKTELSWVSDDMPSGLVLITNDGRIPMNSMDKIVLPAGEYKIVLKNSVPERFTVSAHPNPFNSSTSIRVSAPSDGYATISIYSIDGKQIETLWEGNLSAGEHTYVWDGKNANGSQVSAGIYFVRTRFGDSVSTLRILFIK